MRSTKEQTLNGRFQSRQSGCKTSSRITASGHGAVGLPRQRRDATVEATGARLPNVGIGHATNDGAHQGNVPRSWNSYSWPRGLSGQTAGSMAVAAHRSRREATHRLVV